MNVGVRGVKIGVESCTVFSHKRVIYLCYCRHSRGDLHAICWTHLEPLKVRYSSVDS